MKKTLNERILAENIRLSNDDRLTGNNANDIVLGGSGSGKSSGYVSANLANSSGQSYVIQDTKGRLYNQFADSLKAKGYEVALIDFVNPSSNSFGYNPLRYIRRRKDGSIIEQDIKKLATQIMPIMQDHDPFWPKSAIRYIAMLISYVCEALPEDEVNMRSVIKMHQLFQSNTGISLMSDWAKDNPDSYTARKYNVMQTTMVSEKTWSSILAFACEALDPFDCLEFDNIFCNDNQFDMTSLGRKKVALFVNVSDHDISYGMLSNILYSQLMQVLLDEADMQRDGRLKVGVRFILDDFGASSAIPNFDNLMSIIRSRGISCSIILQSLSQLRSMYSESSATCIINNCDTILFLSTNDLKTAEFIGNHINQTPHSVLSLPSDKAILIMRGKQPQIVNKIKPQFPSPEPQNNP